MFSLGRQVVALAILPLVTAAIALPSPVLAADVATPAIGEAAPATGPQAQAASPAAKPVAIDAAPLVADTGASTVLAALAASLAAEWSSIADPAPASASAQVDPELECMAKVVHHEAGRKSRDGQLAVAQLIMNRKQSGRFASTICGVANQPGQFFRTAAYNPPRDDADWANAVEVSRQARDGTADAVAPGALFFRSAVGTSDGFFRKRERVASLGGNIFYR